ncbi:MAG: cupin domain-containing protein [Nocardioidaceae bacterium]|nr:cupin domain-containing protein [Nocardioidaceae bacterium]
MNKLNVGDLDFEYDASDPEGFRAGMKRFGKQLGARVTGTSIYELPPGQAICPYHYEYAEEEWLIVLEGTPTLRRVDGEERLRPWDVCVFVAGPDGAHGVRNETDEVVRVMMFSDVKWPAATVYPDSDKIGVYTGNEADNAIFPRSAAVEYFHGEPGTGR